MNFGLRRMHHPLSFFRKTRLFDDERRGVRWSFLSNFRTRNAVGVGISRTVAISWKIFPDDQRHVVVPVGRYGHFQGTGVGDREGGRYNFIAGDRIGRRCIRPTGVNPLRGESRQDEERNGLDEEESSVREKREGEMESEGERVRMERKPKAGAVGI